MQRTRPEILKKYRYPFMKQFTDPELGGGIKRGADDETANVAQPAPQFRDDLHRALEETHRQQAARRALGAHVSEYQQELDEQRRQRRTLSLLASLIMLLAWLWWHNKKI